jgi:hypothetical protein
MYTFILIASIRILLIARQDSLRFVKRVISSVFSTSYHNIFPYSNKVYITIFSLIFLDLLVFKRTLIYYFSVL